VSIYFSVKIELPVGIPRKSVIEVMVMFSFRNALQSYEHMGSAHSVLPMCFMDTFQKYVHRLLLKSIEYVRFHSFFAPTNVWLFDRQKVYEQPGSIWKEVILKPEEIRQRLKNGRHYNEQLNRSMASNLEFGQHPS